MPNRLSRSQVRTGHRPRHLDICRFAVGFIRTASANAFLDAPHNHPYRTRLGLPKFNHRSWPGGRCRLLFTASSVDESRSHGGNSPRHHDRSLYTLSIHAQEDSGSLNGFQHTCDTSHRIGGSSSRLEKPEVSRTSFFRVSS